MPLILAIEPDSRQASLVSELARGLVDAELILTTSAAEALRTFETRVPDLVLTSTLLSPADENLLTERLRTMDSAGAHVRTLVIPLLAEPQLEPQSQGGLLSRLGWRKPKASRPDGCDPSVFAGQISEYLNRAHVLRRAFTPLPPSTLQADSFPAPLEETRPEWEAVEVAPAAAPAAASLLFADPVPTLDLFRVDEPLTTGVPITIEEPVLSVPRPRWAEPLVTDIDALGAELDAALAAHTEAVDDVDAVIPPVTDTEALAEAPELINVTAPDVTIDEPAADEPIAALPTFRPDLLELLAAIQLDLEPLRSTPGQRSSAPTKPAGNVQDEWGFFDPQQCGMAALLARLDQMAERRDGGTNRN